jgi:transposase IS166 family protein
MDINLATLPDDVETLQRLVRSLAAERASLSEAKAEIERLNLIIKKLQRSQFGRRAERVDDDQLLLGALGARNIALFARIRGRQSNAISYSEGAFFCSSLPTQPDEKAR